MVADLLVSPYSSGQLSGAEVAVARGVGGTGTGVGGSVASGGLSGVDDGGGLPELERRAREASLSNEVLVSVFRSLVRELGSIRENRVAITKFRRTGVGTHITGVTASGIGLTDSGWRPVYVRCHFTGTTGANRFVVSVDSGGGSAYDTQLYAMETRGVAAGGTGDVNLAFSPQEWGAWTFMGDDVLVVNWTNPGGVTWGLEVGLAAA
jgi:hypothetical protein